jgi:hypothetical protein
MYSPPLPVGPLALVNAVRVPQPIILFGALRSGTTLIRLMLDGHPDIACGGESDFMFDYLSRDASGAWAIDTPGMTDDWIRISQKIEWRADLSPEQALQDVVQQFRGTKACVVLILHRGLDKALDVFPDAPVIHMLRDPRDVASSSVGMGWAGNSYFGVDHWLSTEAEWETARAGLPPERRMELRYEDLIRDPTRRLTQVAEFMGLAYHSAMLSYPSRSKYGVPDGKLAEQWRKRLSKRELGLLEGKVGGLLSERGYAASGAVLHRATQADLRRLAWQNWYGRWRHRIGHFGVVDPVLETLARRLRVPAISRWAQRRINRKVVAYLR